MTTTVEIIEPVNELATINPNEAALVKMRDTYGTLVISGPDDKVGTLAVAQARLECKAARCTIEQQRKALKEPLLERGRLIDNEAKRLTAIIKPTEDHLIAEEKKADDWEAARLREEARKAEEERKRKEQEERDRIKAQQDAENARLAAERAKLDEERKAMEAERAKAAAAQKAEADRLAAIQRQIDDARKAQEAEAKRLADEDDAKPKPVEPPKPQYQAQAAFMAEPPREPVFLAGAVHHEPSDAIKMLAAAPSPFIAEDRAKLLTVAACIKGIDVPAMATMEGMEAATRINAVLDKAAGEIRNIVACLPVANEIADEECAPF